MGSELLISIPKRLRERLQVDSIWTSKVTGVINYIKDIFITTPVFFPEYTNHGVVHINHVLEISDRLISDITLQKLSPKALGIYLISAMLHDIGMFINYDMFKRLIEDNGSYTKVSGLDDRPLKEYWNTYLTELKRLSDKALVRKFGTTDIKFTRLPSHGKMSSTDILVIGEFIRQHHHKISQYVILHNFMDNDLLNQESDSYRKMIGITARSHGMNIRETEEYLDKNFTNARRPNDVEIYYLMCVLRMADYLDAGNERASHIIESMFVKHSEISQNEYSWNQCIYYDDFGWDIEKELLTIEAAPEKPEQFINVTKWLNAVQNELDLCWAIIGEHYKFNDFSLTIRRVYSNVLKQSSIDEFEKRFYTKPVSLNANSDILKLLIEPLYGDDPSYGVRELIQNATDACKERKAISKEKKYDGKVTVSLDTKNKVLTVKDNGVGMSIDTIVNYYLSAGASYRNSNEWAKRYTNSHRKSKVERNGKFGIGVLATFLLGDKATVTTRHLDDDLGWTFDIQLNQDNIEITRTNVDYGTTISITMDSETVDKLTNDGFSRTPKWNEWYCDSFPEVSYILDERQLVNDMVFDMMPWHSLEQNDYKSYKWTYFFDKIQRNCIICNGIIIPDMPAFQRHDKYRSGIVTPQIRIEDTESRLPINLSRSELFEVPCHEKLYTECCRYVLAKLLIVSFNLSKIKDVSRRRMKFVLSPYCKNDSLVFSENGYMLCDPAFMKHAGMQRINVLYVKRNYREDKKTFIDNITILYKEYADLVYRTNSELSLLLSSQELFGYGVRYKTEYIFANQEVSALVERVINLNYTSSIFEEQNAAMNLIGRVGEYNVWESSDKHKVSCEYYADFKCPMVAEIELKYDNMQDDIMLNVLREYIPSNTFIPYDLEERKKLFPKAFEELAEYMYD